MQGLVSGGECPIHWPDALADDDTSDEQRRRAAILAGAVLHRRIGSNRTWPEEVLLVDIAYAAALATPQGQRCLRAAPQNPLKAHAYACVLAERHGHSISEAEEIDLFTWLLDRLAIESTDALVVQMRKQRLRRHTRLAGG